MLEEIDEEEEDVNFELYLSDEKNEDEMPDNNLSDENTDSISFTRRTV